MNNQQQIDNLKSIIKTQQDMVDKLEAEQSEPQDYILKYHRPYMVGTDYVMSGSGGTSKSYLSCARYRQTKAQAEHTLAREKHTNRLEALVMDIQGDEIGGDWYIFLDQKNIYQTGRLNDATYPEVIMMKEQTAIKVCELLNNKQYSLED